MSTIVNDTVIIDHAKTVCDGDKASPHPRVYLTVSLQGDVECPYCGKHFVLSENAHADAH